MDEQLIEKLLKLEEGQDFECKRVLKKPSEVLPTICAFANADGGILVYGIGDKKQSSGKERLFGISEKRENCDDLLKLMANGFTPPLPSIDHKYIDTLNVKGESDQILMIFVEGSKTVHSLMSGQTYMRRGSQNSLLTHEQSMRLQYEKGVITFESELASKISWEAMDQNLIREFMEHNKSEEKDVLRFFAKNGLADFEDGKIYLNHAAVLIFSENPTILLKRKCGITISHYFGVKRQISANPNFIRPPFTIERHLLYQIKEAFRYVSENALPIKLEGATFKRMKIPEFVIQEAITNAVIHRDYSIQDNIHIRIFDNRIEVESPGWFPGFVTPETILDDRFARNPILERTLKKMPNPPNLDIGEGVNRMFLEMQKKILYAPLYLPRDYTPHSVCVILFNEEKTSYWDIVEKYLVKNGFITNKRFCEISGLDTLRASEFLKKWTKQKFIEKEGTSKRNTAYRKPTTKRYGRTSLLGRLF
ncbi:MAG TPA: RNA-binding domain-containing protein [Candidatus Wujingus californicus]|uniref:RNA-binding domain-containing protein n=1 Tax=Candidatus Wunengus californicus TaxID=3367619 RepID=UPI0040254B76|nr:putative DNA binding domain-containing protein [Planctomycetota bacterium]